MALSFEEKRGVLRDIRDNYAKLQENLGFKAKLEILRTIEELYAKLHGETTANERTIVGQLLDGEFLQETPQKFYDILLQVFGMLDGMVTPVVDPIIAYLKLHKAEKRTKNQDELIDKIREGTLDCDTILNEFAKVFNLDEIFRSANMADGFKTTEVNFVKLEEIAKQKEPSGLIYELPREQRGMTSQLAEIDDASVKFDKNADQHTNSTASLSEIVEPLNMASELSVEVTSSSLYGKSESVLGRIRNTLPSTANAQGISSYSTNSSMTTGSKSEPSHPNSTGNSETTRPLGKVTGTNPEANAIEKHLNLVNLMAVSSEQETPGEANPIEQEILNGLNDILADKYGDDSVKIGQVLDALADKAESAGLMEKLDGIFMEAAGHLTAVLKKLAAAVL